MEIRFYNHPQTQQKITYIMQVELTNKEKSILFWGSFLALMAAGMAFTYRALSLSQWGEKFNLSGAELGGIVLGSYFWPIAVTMILFSLVVDAIGYKPSMIICILLHAASVVMSFMADSVEMIKWSAIMAGFAHGIIEAVINPVCAAVYNKEKTKWLNILHAAWPAGLMVCAIIMFFTTGLDYKANAIWYAIPIVIYAVMLLMSKFPVDERVAAKVPYKDSLKDVGFLSSSIAAFLLVHALYGVFNPGKQLDIYLALGIGVAIGAVFGLITKSWGKIMYFILCLLMIPLATTELGTDGWIQPMMQSSMGKYAGLALALSAGIMMILRFQAGIFTKRFTAPVILTVSSFFSMTGLILLSQVNGASLIILAFVIYAVGQTFYWPTVLGFASEQFPKGGAMSLNTVSAIGLLSVGIIGAPIIGAFQDNHAQKNVKEVSTEIYESSKKEAVMFNFSYEALDGAKATAMAKDLGLEEEVATAQSLSGKQALFTTALAFPLVMGICYFLIAIWYKSRGGYKPIELTESTKEEDPEETSS